MKAAKTPAVSDATKILSFDIESNGLHGQAFAVAGVVVDMKSTVVDSFTARIKINAEVDEWVKEHVLPVIDAMPVTHGNYQTMCDAFWRWFVRAQEASDYVVVANGYPVEYRFLLDCQETDIDARYWEHPFPILDLPSMHIGNGQQAEASRLRTVAKALAGQQLVRHHPYDDALTTALTAIELLKLHNT